MRWISHTMISASLCAVWQPALMPAAVLGATAPDWLEWLGRRHLPLALAVHRGRTHNLLAWLLLLVLGWAGQPSSLALAAFALGGVLHWFCDALTVTGAPLTWWSQHRSTLFGGRLRQGGKTERALAWGVMLCCAALMLLQHAGRGERFSPYVMPWQQHYQHGLLDAAEWRRHRFSPF